MANTEPEEVTPAAESPAPAAANPKPKKGKATKKAAAASRKPTTKAKAPKQAGERKVPTHPPTGQLVNEAIGKLNERGGSSLQAIKKSIADSHKFDVEKLAPFIRKYLKSAVEKGSLVQTKGKGANGSFKLPPKEKKAKPAAEKSPNDALELQVKEPAAVKEASKSKSSKKPATVKKAAKPVKAKSPAKPKAPTDPKVASTKAAPKSKAVKASAVEKKRKSPAVENKAKAPKAAKPKVKAPAKPKVARVTRKAAAVPASAIN